LYVENVRDDIYHDAKVGVFIDQKRANKKIFFREGKPVYKLSLDIYVRVAQIIEPNKTYDIYNEDRIFLTKELKKKLKEKILSTLGSATTIAKENNTDIMHACKDLSKYHNKQYKRYLSQNQNNPLQNITFEYDINIRERL
jgi:hypothetical protein